MLTFIFPKIFFINIKVLFIINSAIIVELKYLKYLSLPFLAIFCLNASSFEYFSIFFDKSLISL